MIEIESKYKNRLINKIKSINDKEVIDDIYRLLNMNFEESIFITSDQQKEEIAFAQKQLNDGLGILSEEADSEIEKWLKK